MLRVLRDVSPTLGALLRVQLWATLPIGFALFFLAALFVVSVLAWTGVWTLRGAEFARAELVTGTVTGLLLGAWVTLGSMWWTSYKATLQHGLIDLVNHAASNAGISSIRDLYRTARLEIRVSLSDPAVANATSPDRKAAARTLHAAEAVLASFCDVDAYRARFMGYPVGFGVVRTVLVTLFTVGIGLWSVLRGAGTYVTLQQACTGNVG
ncbi:hypothetical protein DFJ74DRAFT_693880 [Hyaloraphidium curvatum]|nr:hypothetical protein DFJ74DRAFT_693880 [Hyaloraphidium curvatum]